MNRKLFYQLRHYFGFTRKESRGFVLLVPILVLLSLSPLLINKINAKSQDSKREHIQILIDSLKSEGFEIVESPRPIHSTLDTIPESQKYSTLNKISFNEADSITLQIVPGIGPTLAGRIIKFRENLGGIYSSSQLNDVYGLKPEVSDRIWTYFEFEPTISHQLDINKLDVQGLAKHPYIGYGEAKVMVAYRNQHGNFVHIDDLLEIKIFNKEWIEKISPYLEFK